MELQLHSADLCTDHASWHQASTCCLDDPGYHLVWVTISCRAPVLHVPLAIRLGLARDTDGCATVGNSVLEGVDVARLMLPRQALVVALAILSDVLRSNLPKGL